MTRTTSGSSDNRSAMLCQPEPFMLMGEAVSVTVPGNRTGGRVAMITSLSPHQGGPPPHIHYREDETLVALDPGFEVLIDGQWAPLAVGAAAFIARGTLHTFRNAGAMPARLVAHYTPAGLERFFAIFASGLDANNIMTRLAAAAATVGTEFFPGLPHDGRPKIKPGQIVWRGAPAPASAGTSQPMNERQDRGSR